MPAIAFEPHDPYTPRERQVLARMEAGRTTRQIALDLGVTHKTAAGYVRRVRRMRLLDGTPPEPLPGPHLLPIRGELAVTLTAREIEVLSHASLGETASEIGGLLFITEGTVKDHLKHIHLRMRVTTTLEAVLEGIRTGVILVAGISPDAVVVEPEPKEEWG